MRFTAVFFVNSLLLGVGLAMDAFSVSLANGLNEPKMRRLKSMSIAGTFGAFQGLMPLIGWFVVCTAAELFKSFRVLIPWIALILLCWIGGSMLKEGIKGGDEDSKVARLTPAALLTQGIATSIDALSVGFTISDYGFVMALVCSLLIAVVTFGISLTGVRIGKTFGTKLSGKATILGGIILIGIGLEIFIKGILS